MNIVQYSKSEHYDALSSWWRGHGQDPPPADVLPPSGVVVPGICAGFLYTTNANVGFIDYFISNPDFREKRAKNQALEMVAEALLRLARHLGLRRLTAHTTIPRLVQRGFGHGAVRKTVTLLEVRYG